MKQTNKTSAGQGFDEATVEAVWRKAAVLPGVDPRLRRMDACGALIDRNAYGVTTPYGTGWEVDHIMPVSRGGSDAFVNLQPLQWENNRRKGENWPHWTCAVRAARRGGT